MERPEDGERKGRSLGETGREQEGDVDEREGDPQPERAGAGQRHEVARGATGSGRESVCEGACRVSEGPGGIAGRISEWERRAASGASVAPAGRAGRVSEATGSGVDVAIEAVDGDGGTAAEGSDEIVHPYVVEGGTYPKGSEGSNGDLSVRRIAGALSAVAGGFAECGLVGVVAVDRFGDLAEFDLDVGEFAVQSVELGVVR